MIQGRLEDGPPPMSDATIAKTYTKLMMQGKVHAATSSLSNVVKKGGVVPLTKENRDVLKQKHLAGEPINEEAMIRGPMPTVDPMLYEGLTGNSIRKSVIITEGARGVSGGDAVHWRHLHCLRDSFYRTVPSSG
eukprot:Lithocolla_globosa_v1_NODE_408_length_4121_cov_32.618066.p2 type:complete len:134 gc:universal NODE_408_length_4121_cov_32.618066:4011-3610(-)